MFRNFTFIILSEEEKKNDKLGTDWMATLGQSDVQIALLGRDRNSIQTVLFGNGPAFASF